MKTYIFFKKSKRSQIYIQDESGNFFRSSKQYNDHTIVPVTAEEAGTFHRITWIIEGSSVEDARYKWVGEQIAAGLETKRLRAEWEKRHAAEITALMEMKVIPTTIENLSMVLEHLNEQNWGSWDLPQMTIGYLAQQHNCGGKKVTTIRLNRPIEFCGRMETKFKSEAVFGYLTKYNHI